METVGIVTYGEPVLRMRSEEIEEFSEDVEQLIERMYEIMAEVKGLGLAAPQIGVAKRVFVYDVGEGPHALVNPKITGSKGAETAIEGCLSIPGLQGEVQRAGRITITGLDENGMKVRIRAEGLLARVFQHEMDHLDGTMFVDRADPDTLEVVRVSSEAGACDEEVPR